VNFRFLSDFHLPEFCFFEIGGDPDFVQRHYREQLLSRLTFNPTTTVLVHFTADGRHDLGVLQIQLRLLQSGAFLLYIGNRGARAGLRR